jgi:dienelactone hydrolase
MKTGIVKYAHEGVDLEGYVAYDEQKTGPRPAILIAHEWFGIGDHERESAERLAHAGYLAFAADLYGVRNRPQTTEEAARMATEYRSGDRHLLRERVSTALREMKNHPQARKEATGAIGFCFGGTAVLELARSGASTRGVVSFHGGLAPSEASRAPKIQAAVLALHGADDPFVPPADVTAFQEEMRSRSVDWQLVFYGATVHSFTNPKAGHDVSQGFAYEPRSAERAWQAALAFFRERFDNTDR